MAKTSETKKEELVSEDNVNDTELTRAYEDKEAEQKIAALEKQIAQMQDLMQHLVMTTAMTQQERRVPTSQQEVTLICNFNGGLHTKFPTWTLSMSRPGQRVIISRNQFQELANTHRKYFERQYIVLDPKEIEIAEQFKIPLYDENSNEFLKPEDFDKIAKMDASKLSTYYSQLSEPMKRIFLSWFMNKCYDKDPGFYVVDKMQALNNLTKSNLFEFLIKLCLSETTQVQE